MPYLLTELLEPRAAAPRISSAVLNMEDLVQEWGSIGERGGMMIENGVLPGDWLGWQHICAMIEIAEEDFRDSKGMWMDTAYTLD